jgi:hypothetical protein
VAHERLTMPPLSTISLPFNGAIYPMVMIGLVSFMTTFFHKAFGLILTGWSPRDRVAGNALAITASALVPVASFVWGPFGSLAWQRAGALTWLAMVFVDTLILRLRSRGHDHAWLTAAIVAMVANAMLFSGVVGFAMFVSKRGAG